MTQSEEVSIRASDRELSVERRVLVSIGQTKRPQNFRHEKLKKRILLLQLSAVLCQESLGKTAQVIQAKVRSKFAPITVKRVTRHVAKQTLRRNFVSLLSAQHSIGDLFLSLFVEVTFDKNALINLAWIDFIF